MNIKCYPIPKTREPFCNTPFTPAGRDPETGEERFWTGTWNSNSGMLGALVTPSGKSRIYSFTPTIGLAGMGAYTAVYVGDETMWLLSDTSVIRRLDLRTGKTEDFLTGARPGLVCAGMPYDEGTGKILFFANTNPGVEGVVFDTKECRVVKHFTNFTESTGVRGSFPNSDGTYSIWFHNVDTSLWIWDPRTDSLTQGMSTAFLVETMLVHKIHGKNGWYVPYTGWVDGKTVIAEPKPDQEIHWWFAASEEYAYGAELTGDIIWRWEFATGKVEKFTTVSNFITGTMTENGDLLIMSLYGELRRYDSTGALRLCVLLDAESYGHVDCMIVADNGLIIGTPFITQRFWLFDENTGKGWDAGKAAPGGGEVLRVWNMGGRIYMASYTEAVLTEYDPTRPTITPENPRPVAKAPTGMRPVAHADDGRYLYYSSNHHYGHIGCIMTKYDTLTGETLYLDNPMDEQHIISLYMQGNTLWGSTTWISDCHCCQETRRDSFLIKLDPVTMEVIAEYPAPEGVNRVNIFGEAEGKLIVGFDGNLKKFDLQSGLFTEFVPMPKETRNMLYTGRGGEFILLHAGKIERWCVNDDQFVCIETILEDHELYNIYFSHGNGNPVLTAAKKKEFYVIRDFM